MVTWGSEQPLTGSEPWPEQVRRALRPTKGDSFTGGVVGWLGYEAGAAVEAMPIPKGPRVLPDTCLWRVDGALWHHEATNEWTIEGSESFQHEAQQVLACAVTKPCPQARSKSVGPWAPPNSQPVAHRYTQGVHEVLEAVRSGEVYQVNLAWEHTGIPIEDGIATWIQLRQINPALRGAYLRTGPFEVLSNSPELFLEVDGFTREVRSRPIKGTASIHAGETGRQVLVQSPKERAELTMIVDLVRNDLGRVCEAGTVHADQRHIRQCGDLWHAEQSVTARLRRDADAVDAAAASFPPGSVTGAPKVQAMKVIHRLEPSPRGVYTGAIGWFADNGSAHLNVAIRTISVVDGHGRFHVGAGIVSDSDPQNEWNETIAKAQALARILGA